MAGRITKSEQQLQPDPRYGDKVLAKFINCVMLNGKKAVAQRCVYAALDDSEQRICVVDLPEHIAAKIDVAPTELP